MSGIRLLSLPVPNGRFAVIAVLALVGWVAPCLGFTLPHERRLGANAAIEKMIAGDYTGALSLCDTIIKNDPEDPMGWMLRSTAIGLHDLDLDSATDSLDFYGVYKKTCGVLFTYEKKYGVSSYSCTVNGFTKAVGAAYDLWRKKYFSGLDLGFDALKVLQEAKKLDNTNIDVDFFLGLYTYARAELKRNFWWAFFWYPGDKSAGIRSLESCRRNSQFTGLAATLLLAEIYYKEKAGGTSLAITDSLLALYPQSRMVLWTCAKRAEFAGDNASAAADYASLAEAYDAVPRALRNALFTRNKAAQLSFAAGDTVRALAACEKVLARGKPGCGAVCRQAVSESERLRSKITREK